MRILIATTSPGKFQEFKAEFADSHLDFVGLKDLKLHQIKFDEPYDSTWENALHKARFFASRSGLPTIAEDTGLYIKGLNGRPGVRAKRWGKNPRERIKKILAGLNDIAGKGRGAYFETHVCFFNPSDGNFSVFNGRADGLIAKKPLGKVRADLQYDSIFYYPPLKKTFAQMPRGQKTLISQRGQAINRLKIFLSRQYSLRQYLAVGALIVKNRKMYLAKRRDLRPEFNNKWEFPGGGVDQCESIKTALLREVKEETGYVIEPLEQLPYIINKTEPKYHYQVFLLLYIAEIKSGQFKTADSEVAGHGWFTLKQAQKLDFLAANKEVIRKNMGLLKKYID